MIFTKDDINMNQQFELIKLFDYPKMKPVKAEELAKFDQKQICFFCHTTGLYQLPTVELMDFLAKEILFSPYQNPIEIGAGAGHIGRSLGIKMCDNYNMLNPEIKEHYEKAGIPITDYGKDVERLDAIEGVKKYRSEVILGCYVSGKNASMYGMSISDMAGLDEKAILDLSFVQKYVVVGNEETHKNKLIFKQFPFKKLKFDWIYGRAFDKSKNAIWIYEK